MKITLEKLTQNYEIVKLSEAQILAVGNVLYRDYYNYFDMDGYEYYTAGCAAAKELGIVDAEAIEDCCYLADTMRDMFCDEYIAHGDSAVYYTWKANRGK